MRLLLALLGHVAIVAAQLCQPPAQRPLIESSLDEGQVYLAAVMPFPGATCAGSAALLLAWKLALMSFSQRYSLPVKFRLGTLLLDSCSDGSNLEDFEKCRYSWTSVDHGAIQRDQMAAFILVDPSSERRLAFQSVLHYTNRVVLTCPDGISLNRAQTGFDQFYAAINPHTVPEPWLLRWWESRFACSTTDAIDRRMRPCSGAERIDPSDLWHEETACVIHAVDMLLHALEFVRNDTCGLDNVCDEFLNATRRTTRLVAKMHEMAREEASLDDPDPVSPKKLSLAASYSCPDRTFLADGWVIAFVVAAILGAILALATLPTQREMLNMAQAIGVAALFIGTLPFAFAPTESVCAAREGCLQLGFAAAFSTQLVALVARNMNRLPRMVFLLLAFGVHIPLTVLWLVTKSPHPTTCDRCDHDRPALSMSLIYCMLLLLACALLVLRPLLKPPRRVPKLLAGAFWLSICIWVIWMAVFILVAGAEARAPVTGMMLIATAFLLLILLPRVISRYRSKSATDVNFWDDFEKSLRHETERYTRLTSPAVVRKMDTFGHPAPPVAFANDTAATTTATATAATIPTIPASVQYPKTQPPRPQATPKLANQQKDDVIVLRQNTENQRIARFKVIERQRTPVIPPQLSPMSSPNVAVFLIPISQPLMMPPRPIWPMPPVWPNMTARRDYSLQVHYPGSPTFSPAVITPPFTPLFGPAGFSMTTRGHSMSPATISSPEPTGVREHSAHEVHLYLTDPESVSSTPTPSIRAGQMTTKASAVARAYWDPSLYRVTSTALPNHDAEEAQSHW